MKYVIVYLIKGRAKKYQERLTNEISSKFKIRNLNNHISPHITLKTPFKKNNIKDIENFLDKFSKKKKKFKIKICRFGSFKNKVIYLNIVTDRNYFRFQGDLIESLSNNKLVYIRKIDLSYKPHATIGFAKNPMQFKKIMDFFAKYNPNFTLNFDNITILKKPKNKWILYKEFNLK